MTLAAGIGVSCGAGLEPVATSVSTSDSPAVDPAAAEVAGGLAVELYFDPALENQVLKAWNALARRQLSTHLIDVGARPHLPLLRFPAAAGVDPLRLLQALRSVAARLDPLPLSLSTVAAYPSCAGVDAGALFLAPTPTAALLGLHAQLCELLRKDGLEPPEGFRPDMWVPRCAVAEGVAKARFAEAFAIVRELRLPVSGYGMDIALVEVPPVREVFSFPLGGTNSDS